ncbi:MAG: ComEC/Rec2 family competence protein [Dehalococcoidia bacterium]
MKLIAAASAFAAGTGLALGFGIAPGHVVPWLAFLLFGLGGLVLFVALRLYGRSTGPALVALVFLLGMWRAASALDASPDESWHNVPGAEGQVTLIGALLGDAAPTTGSNVRLRLLVEAVSTGDEFAPAHFAVDVYTTRLADASGQDRPLDGFRYGDRFRVSGFFRPGSQAGDATAGSVSAGPVTLLASDAGNPVRRHLAGLRQSLAASISRSISEPAAGLAAAMVVGDRTRLNAALTESFRNSGTAHVLAISGLHVALVGGMTLVGAAVALGRRRQVYLLPPFMVTFGYAALAGFSPSVTRAAIMFSVYLLARALGRQRSVLPAIGLAAALMVATDPVVLSSVSFQLSFAAVAGIAVLVPPISERVRDMTASWIPAAGPLRRITEGALVGAAVSAAATVATAPLVALYFGTVPVWGVAATLLMMPALPLFVVAAGASAGAGSMLPWMGQAAGWPAWLAGEYMAAVAELFSGLPPGPVNADAWAVPATAAYYVALALFLARRPIKAVAHNVLPDLKSMLNPAAAPTGAAHARATPPNWLIAVVAVIAVIAWIGAIQDRPGDHVTVTFFETGQGDLVLIETPGGTQALIDGGLDPQGAVRALDGTLPFWDRHIDLVMLTHPDADHLGGLQAVIERYDVGLVMDAPVEHNTALYDEWKRITGEHPRHMVAEQGQSIALDDDVALHVLQAGAFSETEPLNDASIVTMLRYGTVSFLLTGDITALGEQRLMSSGANLASTVLKLPHHGSNTSSTESFLHAVSPVAVVVTNGSDNQFDHPSPEVMERVEASVAGNNVFVTSESGDVTFRTDGELLWAESAR